MSTTKTNSRGLTREARLSLLAEEPVLVDEGPAMRLLRATPVKLNELIATNVLTNCTVVGSRRLFRRVQIRALIEAEAS